MILKWAWFLLDYDWNFIDSGTPIEQEILAEENKVAL